MYNGLLHLHNLMRWVILLLLVVAIIKAFVGMSANRPFTKGDKQVGLFLMISAHITLLIGLYQWLAGRYGLLTTSLPPGTNLMKDSFYRFYWIEHPVGMILAVALITIGRAQTKKNVPDVVKHKKSFWYYLFALIVILVTVPWPFREIVGRPLFPGMH
jgi:glucan phosphoethanolaminetransferase (alkaline phosphatase superfamily)